MLCSWLFLMNYSKRNKKKNTGVALSVRCIEVAASHLLLLPSRVVYRPTRFNLTSMFEYSSFFCFIMCWAFPRLICPPTSWFRIGRELCRKWWVRTQAGPTLATFLFSHYQRERDVLAATRVINFKCCFTAHCCDILLLLYCGFIFFFMLILKIRS